MSAAISTAATPSTLVDLLERVPGEQTAIILPDQNIRVTYAALQGHVQVVAEQLAAAGVRRGDRVGIALPNGLPMIVSFLAAAFAGTAAPLNPSYTEDEFRFFLEDTAARALILPPVGGEEARRAAGDAVPILVIDMDASGTMSLASLKNSARVSSVNRPRSVTPPGVDDVALVLHTSGSSGRPKRVPLAHSNLSISAGTVARSYALGPDDVSLCVMPLFDAHGLVASTLATLSTGGTVVAPIKFNPLSFWRVARDHGVTWYSAVPALHQLLLARAADPTSRRPAGTERLRFIRSCGASLPPPLMHALETAFGAPVLEAYDMTEAAHQVASNPLPPAERRPGSVGPGTGVHIGIVDAKWRHLPVREHGEIVIQGPNVIRGYEDNPEANASLFVDGWFRTGDQGYLDADGYLTLVAPGATERHRGKIVPETPSLWPN
jgi:acyl-CoA synthetase (AMP-forming)/AMP-acid ligase II